MSFHLINTYYSPSKQSLVNNTSVVDDGVVPNSKVTPITLDLFDTKQQQSPPRLELKQHFSKNNPKRSLDNIQHCEEEEDTTMNRKNGNNNIPKLDLKLNLSTPSSRLVNTQPESPSRTASVSPPSSCLSSEMSSPEACSMVVVGCPRCLMYVMLSEDDPKCPKCKSTVLLDFMHDTNTTNSGSSKKTRKT